MASDTSTKDSFQEIAKRVLRHKALRAKRTQKNAEWQLDRLIRNFGEFSILEISEELWVEYIAREVAKKRRKFYDDRKYMLNVLLFAHRKGLIQAIPRLPIPDMQSWVGREILTDELKRLEEAGSAALRFQIQICWKMGLRLGEMLRLHPSKIDVLHRLVLLSPADTKTRRGRKVPIPSDLWPGFEARMAQAPHQFFFLAPGKAGVPQTSNKTAWRKCREAAGVSARWHDLRHTCATLMLRRGVPEHLVRKILGMSRRVLSEIYMHLSAGDLQRAARVMVDGSSYQGKIDEFIVVDLAERYSLEALRAAAKLKMQHRLVG